MHAAPADSGVRGRLLLAAGVSMTPSPDDELSVAISGETMQRIDQCTNCHAPMLYRCHPSGELYEMFCAARELAKHLREDAPHPSSSVQGIGDFDDGR